MGDGYPKREPYFAQRYIRTLYRTCASHDIGPTAMLLVILVATTEDSRRYTSPVRFFNDQLRNILGVSYGAFQRARKRAVEAGWLQVISGARGTASRYWVTIPSELERVPDHPLGNDPNLSTSGQESHPNLSTSGQESSQTCPPADIYPDSIRTVSGQYPDSIRTHSYPIPYLTNTSNIAAAGNSSIEGEVDRLLQVAGIREPSRTRCVKRLLEHTDPATAARYVDLLASQCQHAGNPSGAMVHVIMGEGLADELAPISPTPSKNGSGYGTKAVDREMRRATLIKQWRAQGLTVDQIEELEAKILAAADG